MIDDILPLASNTKSPLRDICLLRYLVNNFIHLLKIEILYFSEYTQNFLLISQQPNISGNNSKHLKTRIVSRSILSYLVSFARHFLIFISYSISTVAFAPNNCVSGCLVESCDPVRLVPTYLARTLTFAYTQHTPHIPAYILAGNTHDQIGFQSLFPFINLNRQLFSCNKPSISPNRHGFKELFCCASQRSYHLGLLKVSLRAF